MLRFTDNLIMQLTRDCNLNCKYCFQGNKSDWKNKRISIEDFKKVVDTTIYNHCVLGFIENKIDFHFHGGEVTLIPEEELKEMIDYLIERRRAFPNIQISFQTNGINLTEDFCGFLAERNIPLGISFDGYTSEDRMSSDFGRKLIDRLSEYHKNTGVSFGVLSVLTSQNIKTWFEDIKEVCQKLECGTAVNLISVLPENENLVPSYNDMINYWINPCLNEFFDPNSKFLERDLDILIGNFLRDKLFNTEKRKKNSCFDRVCARMANMINIDPDLKLSGCDKFMEDGEYINLREFTDYDDRDFLGLQTLSRTMKYYKAMGKLEKEKHCDSCYARNVCSGECQSAYISSIGDVRISDTSCKLYRYIYDFLDDNWIHLLNRPFRIEYKIIEIKPDALKILEKNNLKLVIDSECMTYRIERK